MHRKSNRGGPLGNKGSAIITVIVAVALVSVLGTILLYMTYTGFQMKLIERQSKSNFYNAEAVMSEIRTGLQLAVSDAIATANTKVLERYNEAVDSAATSDSFKAEFSSALVKWKPTGYAAGTLLNKNDQSIPLTDGGTYVGPCYRLDMLNDFITAGERMYVTVHSGLKNAEYGELSIEKKIVNSVETVTAFVMKNVTVTYVKNGFMTVITSDISIKVPDFAYEISNIALTSIQDYVIIAASGLKQGSGGGLRLDGNVYAGAVDISGSGNTLTLGDEYTPPYLFITKGNINVDTSTALTVGPKTDLWANRIVLGKGSTLTLHGSAYVADDLALDGNNSTATLKGRYYGFGYDMSDSTKSSTILINGNDTDLTLDPALHTLMLAGRCFIGTGNVSSEVAGAVNTDLLTGESISSRSNQLAYLIPPECITINIPAGYGTYLRSNPAIFPNIPVPPNTVAIPSNLEACVDTTKALWVGGGSLNDYGAAVKVIYVPAGSWKLVYFYMDFSNEKLASDYFRAYFQAHSDKIDRYMRMYSNTLSLSGTTDKLLSGNALYYDTGSKATGTAALLAPASAGFLPAALRLETMYKNLCQTLSPTNSDTGSEVYAHIVNIPAVEPLTADMLFYAPDGTVAGIITKSSYTTQDLYDAYSDTLKVMLSTADITVNREFKGLIIAGGTVDLQKSLYLDKSGVSTALSARNDLGKSMLDYLKIGSGGSSSASGRVSWDMENLVSYDNWSKS